MFISVDSELATRTKTSASRQNLSIQLSSCDVTSVPGLQSGQTKSNPQSVNCVVLHVATCYFQICPKWVEFILLPVYEHQIISKKGTLGLRPKHTDKTAGVQALVHVESVSQLIHGLQRRQRFCFIDAGLILERACALIFGPKIVLKSTKKNQNLLAYLDALLLIRALSLQISFVFIGAFHTQEAVCGVANSTGQHSVPQHGINHCAFTITGPGRKHSIS